MKKRHTITRGKRQLADSAEQVEEKIRKRAYELYELRGREHGLDLEDWLKAESEVSGGANRQ
ncbi:MAG TPA: DUF2934 domain-containing protein [Terriglobales bacterium]|nr:DUF2934 domain-containing protein [Terriglobales bacterium]